jgi:hypothetical protein
MTAFFRYTRTAGTCSQWVFQTTVDVTLLLLLLTQAPNNRGDRQPPVQKTQKPSQRLTFRGGRGDVVALRMPRWAAA